MYKAMPLMALITLFSHTAVFAETTSAALSVDKVDPGKSVGDALKNGDGNCTIVYQDGKPYRVCGFSLPIDVQNAIRQQGAR